VIKHYHLFSVTLSFVFLTAIGSLFAQTPTLGYLYPPAIQRGSTSDVQIGGFDLTPDMQVFVLESSGQLKIAGELGTHLVPPRPYWEGPRIFMSALPLPREFPATLNIPSEHEVGLVHWQLANANGATGTATFLVSDHKEITESRFRDNAMTISELPIGISGRLSRLTEKDVYYFTSPTDQQITIDSWARRLGSDINIAIQVYDSGQTKLVDEVDTEGRDLTVSFTASAKQTYKIVVHEADFRGAAHFVYRLAMTSNAEAGTSEDRLVLDESGKAEHSFQVQAGKHYRVDARSQAIGADLDLVLELLDSEGKSLGTNDDYLAGTVDASVRIAPTSDMNINASVLGFADGGSDHRYEIALVEELPSFTLTASQTFKANLGTQLTIPVAVTSIAGFKADITLSAENLPPGVSLAGDPPVIKAGQAKGNIVLEIAADAATTAQAIRIIGKSAANAETGLQAMTVVATAPTTGNLAVRDPTKQKTESLLLALTMPAPFELNLIDKNRQRVVSRGTTYPAPFILNRNEGYTGVVRLVMAAKQSRHRMGLTGPVLSVPADQREVFYPCFMPEWLTTDRTTRMVVYAYGEVKDPQGNIRHIGKNSDARITMIMEGALLKLGHTAEEITIAPGDSFSVPVNILRSPKLQTDVKLDVELPEDLKELVRCEPVILSVNQQQHALEIQTSADARLQGSIPITLRATTFQDGKWLVKSIVDVEVYFK
jgi:hypothetical protein